MTIPEWVEPMAATLTQERFAGPDWIFERKFDGIRLLAFKNGSDVRLLSRNRLPQHIPALADAIATLPVRDLILDGEVTWDRSVGKGDRPAGAVPGAAVDRARLRPRHLGGAHGRDVRLSDGARKKGHAAIERDLS
jgi:ATP-dependent DNA ligase